MALPNGTNSPGPPFGGYLFKLNKVLLVTGVTKSYFDEMQRKERFVCARRRMTAVTQCPYISMHAKANYERCKNVQARSTNASN